MKTLPIDHAARLRLAVRIKALRLQLGLTQEQLGVRLDMSLKAVQRLESGNHNPTLDTIAWVAKGLDVDLARLLDHSPLHSPPSGLGALAALGWRVRPGRPRGHALPVVDIVAAAGQVPLLREGTVIAHATPPHRTLRTEGLFLVQIQGDSMQPLVPTGAWCLFRQPAEQPWVGRNLLICLPDLGGWMLKRVAAVEAPETGGWRVRLTSRNPAYDPIDVSFADASDFVAAGELVEVLA